MKLRGKLLLSVMLNSELVLVCGELDSDFPCYFGIKNYFAVYILGLFPHLSIPVAWPILLIDNLYSLAHLAKYF
jgi:hypothetical protein